MNSENFAIQANEIKRQTLKWNPQKVVIDGNGVG